MNQQKSHPLYSQKLKILNEFTKYLEVYIKSLEKSYGKIIIRDTGKSKYWILEWEEDFIDEDTSQVVPVERKTIIRKWIRKSNKDKIFDLRGNDVTPKLVFKL